GGAVRAIVGARGFADGIEGACRACIGGGGLGMGAGGVVSRTSSLSPGLSNAMSTFESGRRSGRNSHIAERCTTSDSTNASQIVGIATTSLGLRERSRQWVIGTRATRNITSAALAPRSHYVRQTRRGP